MISRFLALTFLKNPTNGVRIPKPHDYTFSAGIKTKEFESIDYGISLTDEYSCWCGSKPPQYQAFCAV